jgi:hypothetical protein
MKKFAIVAYDSYFGGLHGIYEAEVVEARDYAQAQIMAAEMSYNVIDDYSYQFEDLDEDDYGIDYEIQEVFSDKDIRDLTNELQDMIGDCGYGGACIGAEFSEKYCQEPKNL